MLFKKSQADSSQNRPRGGEARKIFKIILVVLIVLLSLIAIWYLPRVYRVKSSLPGIRADIENEVIPKRIKGALDGLSINLTIKKFQLLNDGAFPSIEHIILEAAADGLPLLLYNERTMEMKTSSDIPATGLDEVSFPSASHAHIWPGYSCRFNNFGDDFDPASSSYADIITPGNSQDFAIVIRHIEYQFPPSSSQRVIHCGGIHEDES